MMKRNDICPICFKNTVQVCYEPPDAQEDIQSEVLDMLTAPMGGEGN